MSTSLEPSSSVRTSTDAQWDEIAPLFAVKATGRPPSTDRRATSRPTPPLIPVTRAGVSTGRWTASTTSFDKKSGRQPGGRTFGWLGRSRRLSKDDEGTPASSRAVILWAMTHLMIKR